MSIKDFTEKIKPISGGIKAMLNNIRINLKIRDDLFIAILIVLLGLASFGLGKLSVIEVQKTPISISSKETNVLDSTSTNNYLYQSTTASTSTGQGIVFGSKSGTKYYYPWCSGANRIKPENIGQAGRISGVSPSDISILLMYLGR